MLLPDQDYQEFFTAISLLCLSIVWRYKQRKKIHVKGAEFRITQSSMLQMEVHIKMVKNLYQSKII